MGPETTMRGAEVAVTEIVSAGTFVGGTFVERFVSEIAVDGTAGVSTSADVPGLENMRMPTPAITSTTAAPMPNMRVVEAGSLLRNGRALESLSTAAAWGIKTAGVSASSSFS